MPIADTIGQPRVMTFTQGEWEDELLALAGRRD